MKKMTVLTILCFLLTGTILHAEGITDYFNGDCLGYAVIEKPSLVKEDFGGTAIGEILKEKEVVDFAAGITTQIDALLAQAGQQSGFDFKAIIEMLKRVEGGIGFSFISYDMEKDFPELAIVVEGIAEKDVEFFTEVTGQIRTIIQQAEGAINITKTEIAGRQAVVLNNPNGKEEVCYILEERNLYISFTKNAMEKIFANKAKKEISPEQAKGLAKCSLGQRGGTLVYLDGARITDILTQKIIKDKGQDSNDYRVFTALHTEDITSVMLHSSVSGKGFYNRVFLGLAENPTGIGKLFSVKKLSEDISLNVPAAAVSFSAATLDLVKIWDAFFTFLGVVDPGKVEPAKQKIGMLEQGIGVKIRDDFLAAFTGEFLSFQLLNEQAGMQQIPEIVLMAKLSKGQPVRVLVNWAFSMLAMSGKIQLKPGKAGEQDAMFVIIKKFGGMKFEPGYAITDDRLVIGTSVKALELGLSKPEQSIQMNLSYSELGKKVAEEEAIGLSFTDIKNTFAKLYATLGTIAMMVPGGGQQFGVDFAKLPVTETFTKHLFGMKSATSQTEGGIFLEAYGPVDYVTIGAGIGAGAAYFSVQRQQIRRARRGGGADAVIEAAPTADANLRELYNACRIYSFDNEGKFPSSLADLYPDYIMDLKLFGSGITRDNIDSKGAFVIVKGVSPNGEANAVLIHERVSPGKETVKAITADGTVKSVNVKELKKTAANPEKF